MRYRRGRRGFGSRRYRRRGMRVRRIRIGRRM